MSRAVEELSQIPFSHLIGSPLKAAIESQALAAQSTIEFIQKVGFKAPSTSPFAPPDMLMTNPSADASAGEIRNVTFKYDKKDENGADKSFSLTVPLLTIVPIPYIRIDEVNIEFSCKLTDQIERKTDSSFQLNASVSGSYGAFWSPVKAEVRVSATYNTASSETAKQTREYTMKVNVRAVQDEMPAGLGKILSILEDSIKEKPAVSAGPTP
jgi:hypothetical protein